MLIPLVFAFSLLLLIWLGFGALYQFVGAVAGLFYHNPEPAFPAGKALPSIRVFIPAYREDVVIEHTVRQVLASHYPADRLKIMVIADGLQPATLQKLRALGIEVLEVQFEKSTKSKALHAALLSTALAPCDVAVVLDADNAPAADFMMRAAGHFRKGSQALQGRRVHKPSRSPLALLDAASEDVNNHILCRGAWALGFSARLAGSAMVFDYAIFAKIMPQIHAIGGFDKALEGALTQQGVRIAYDEAAVVFDEKVSQAAVFSQQRGRWIAAQFHFCRQFLPAAIRDLFRYGNVDFFYKALQMALPPRLLAPGLLVIGTLISVFLNSPAAYGWTLALILNVGAFAIALPSWLLQKKYFGVWLHLPQAFFAALWALLKIPQAGRVFLVTPKSISH